jgi:hypothetical protein
MVCSWSDGHLPRVACLSVPYGQRPSGKQSTGKKNREDPSPEESDLAAFRREAHGENGAMERIFGGLEQRNGLSSAVRSSHAAVIREP